MTKKDYIKIANVIKGFSERNSNVDPLLIDDLIYRFSDMLEANNINFNQKKFVNYIYNGVK